MKRILFALLALCSIAHAADHLPPYLLRAEAQKRVTGTCPSAIKAIAADGSVTCGSGGGGGGGGAWGEITGTLSDQTDLQAALDLKVPTARTVNGHALSANVTVTASDVGADASGAASAALASAEAYTDSAVAPYLLSATAASTYQPLDSDLTAIAALSTTSFGRSVLTQADAAAGRLLFGLGTLATQSGTFSGTSSGTNTGDQDLSGYLLSSTAASTYQPIDSDLTAFAGLAIAADKLPYGTGSHTLGLTDLTAAGRALLDDADAAAQRTTLGLGTLATSSAALPVTIAQSSHLWLDSYASGTGLFTASRPACADLSDSGTGCGATIANYLTTSSAASTYVPQATTVAGHALSGNVTVSASDVGLGSVTNDAQTKAAIVPNTAPSAGQILAGNAGGTAYAPATLSGSGATASLSSAGVLTLSAIPNATLSNSSITVAGHSISLGGSSAVACADLSNGATGCSTATGTSGATIPLLNGTNTWSGAQSFNSSDLILKGATSGTITLNAAATAGSNTLTLPAGTTDLSATGGTSQVLKQTSAGGAITVARLACSDLSDSGTDCTTSTGGIPQNSKSAAYTTVLGDAGKHIFHPSADTTARTWTIDSNANVAYTIGTTLTFINQHSAGVITIAITSDTMRLASTGTTGSRTLAADGIATAVKVTSTEWLISGTGLN